MARKPETKFRNDKVIPFLRTLKNTFYFTIQQLSISGTPDLLLCCHGRFVALELKSEEGEPSELQKFNLAEVKRTHGVSLVARPSNWEEIKEILIELDKGEAA